MQIWTLRVARHRDPVAVLGLDDHVQVELDANIGALPQIVDAVCASREAALVPPSQIRTVLAF